MTKLEELVSAQLEAKDQIAYRLASYIKLAKPRRTAMAIETRLADVREYWNESRKRHLEIVQQADDTFRMTHKYFIDNVFEAIPDTMDETRDALKEHLAAIRPLPVPGPATVEDSSSTAEPKFNAVSLPSISLPKFSGDITAWCSFRDLFSTLVASRTDLSDSQRLHYLKASLQGEASRLLINMAITEANYSTAWATLEQRYGRQRAIVYTHLQRFVDSPRAGSGSVRELKALLDLSREVRSALLNLSRPIDKWEDLFVFTIVSKLDKSTRRDWELSLSDVNLLPDFALLETFLNNRIGALESVEPSAAVDNTTRTARSRPEVTRVHQASPARQPRQGKVNAGSRTHSAIVCVSCGEAHLTYQCNLFLSLSPPQRIALMQKHGRCLNCFSPSHIARNCTGKYRCRYCQQPHHSLLHVLNKPASTENAQPSTPVLTTAPVATHGPDLPTEASTSSNFSRTGLSHTVLPTASVLLTGTTGRSYRVRALLDQGSQSSFVAQSVVQVLRPTLRPVSIRVSGIGAATVGAARQVASLRVRSMSGDLFDETIHALVLPKLSSYIPPPVPVTADLSYLKDLTLADSQPFSNAPIDLIIGADHYGRFLRDGLIIGSDNSPSAQNTVFGWVLSGRLLATPCEKYELLSSHLSVASPLESVQDTLCKFWEVEEVPSTVPESDEDKACEAHFKETFSRLPDGRYMVRLPFKSPPPLAIGSTSQAALRMFLSTEIRLNKRPALLEAYTAFLLEYEQLAHMERIAPEEPRALSAVYLPHHPVVKESSTTTKVRVVFNASCPSSNGSSLNDFLCVGPKLQADLFSIILRWRTFRYVYTGDLEKMFRQIQVHPADRNYQRIYWRPSPDEEVLEFRLTTVTYGTASAPFLANRVIAQLVEDEGANFPLASPILQSQIYVDDVMFGGDDPIILIETRKQLAILLMAGGFRPHKWAANSAVLLKDIALEDVCLSPDKPLGEDATLKVLGVVWDPSLDAFSFRVQPQAGLLTKRTFLSLISRIFDPHGWVAPFIISGKILMQRLWLHKVGWDEPLTADLSNSMALFQSQLPLLNRIALPRWTRQAAATRLELHGYADASNSAFAAVVYLRVETEHDQASVSLLFAKTKVAPIKILSVPRLELCAAVLLVRALEFVQRSMHLSSVPITCWTDSAVVLAWLKSPPSRWKVFVAHRVSFIQQALPTAVWRHVPTGENPADCASRGVSAEVLLTHPLWWTGPPWLSASALTWPCVEVAGGADTDLEGRKDVCAHTASGASADSEWDLPLKYSSWPRLLRITCYIFRFINRLRHRTKFPSSGLSASEIAAARTFWCRSAQVQYLGVALKPGEAKLPSALGKVKNLTPFVDSDGLVRVGGRLRNSKLPFEAKHPLLIPVCRIAELLVRHAHVCTLHGGLRVSLHFLRQHYWVVTARSLMKHCLFRCVVCTRHRAQTSVQLLGDLPKPRVTPSRPFSHTGVDYAGPFSLRSSKGRGVKTHKAYIVVFVCLAVRAVHLEVADDYATGGFLSAFERFSSRRGMPSDVYSDNGTNFVGAERELSRCLSSVLRDPNLQSRFANDGVTWHFIPPAAPHFGGLWEAGVKSVKYHLRRIVGNFTPTYEEFSTLLCKVECVLNSRPIGPLHDDVESLEAITPGHFLTGSHLKVVPKPSVLDVRENRLSRWHFVDRAAETFWKVWAADYLNSVQQRGKWRTPQPNLKVNDLVLLKSHALPPAKWELGRVTECFPGADDLVRVVLVKTEKSAFKRPVTQVCRLPIDPAA